MLWLDDLDDLVFSGALLGETLRTGCLQIGLFAALILVICELSTLEPVWAPIFAGVAACSVSLWLAGAAFMGLRRLDTVARHIRA